MGEFALDLGGDLVSRMDFSSVCAIMCKLHAKMHSIFQIHTWLYHLAMRLILLQITDMYIDMELVCFRCTPFPILEKYRQIQNSILDFLQPVGVIHLNHIRHGQQLCQLDECLPIRKNMVALMQPLSPKLPSYNGQPRIPCWSGEGCCCLRPANSTGERGAKGASVGPCSHIQCKDTD